MSPEVQLYGTFAIGAVVGGVAALSAKGRGLVFYFIFGVVGSFIGKPFLDEIGIRFATGPIEQMIDSIFGAVVLVIVVRIIFRIFQSENRDGRDWHP